MSEQFGTILKEWRGKRRMSQMELGLVANVSARHISFLETGRSKPSKSMVMMLSKVLELPIAMRNSLLGSAGFAPAYGKRDLSDRDMAYIRQAVARMLDRHDPYPAFAFDRHWNVVKTNKCAGHLLAASGVVEGDSLLEAILDENGMSQSLENLDEVIQHFIIRLRTESNFLGGDAVLDKAILSLTETLGEGASPVLGTLPAVIPARYKAGGVTLSLFSTIAQFGSAEDIALSELKIEMMFPADDQTKMLLEKMASS